MIFEDLQVKYNRIGSTFSMTDTYQSAMDQIEETCEVLHRRESSLELEQIRKVEITKLKVSQGRTKLPILTGSEAGIGAMKWVDRMSAEFPADAYSSEERVDKFKSFLKLKNQENARIVATIDDPERLLSVVEDM